MQVGIMSKIALNAKLQNKILDADVVRVISVAKKILAYKEVREFFETTQNCSECAADKI